MSTSFIMFQLLHTKLQVLYNIPFMMVMWRLMNFWLSCLTIYAKWTLMTFHLSQGDWSWKHCTEADPVTWRTVQCGCVMRTIVRSSTFQLDHLHFTTMFPMLIEMHWYMIWMMYIIWRSRTRGLWKHWINHIVSWEHHWVWSDGCEFRMNFGQQP